MVSLVPNYVDLRCPSIGEPVVPDVSHTVKECSTLSSDLEAEVKSKTRGSGDGEGKTGDVAQLKGEESASQSDESSLRRGDCVIQEKDETSQTHIRELTQQLQDNETVLAAFQQKHVQQEIEIEQLHTTISAKHTEHNPPELQLLPFSAFRAAPGTSHLGRTFVCTFYYHLIILGFIIC